MSTPPTLLDLVGVETAPHRLADSTVLIIDAQAEYTSGRMPLAGVDAALDETAKLLARARAAGRPVVHIRHQGGAGTIFDPDGPTFAFLPQAVPLDGEPVVIKKAINGFADTDLDAVLKKLDTKSLIVGGFMTHMCISTTVRAAVDLGYESTIVGGACATRDLPDGSGGVVPAADLQRASLAALADRFAVIVDSVDDLAG